MRPATRGGIATLDLAVVDGEPRRRQQGAQRIVADFGDYILQIGGHAMLQP